MKTSQTSLRNNDLHLMYIYANEKLHRQTLAQVKERERERLSIKVSNRRAAFLFSRWREREFSRLFQLCNESSTAAVRRLSCVLYALSLDFYLYMYYIYPREVNVLTLIYMHSLSRCFVSDVCTLYKNSRDDEVRSHCSRCCGIDAGIIQSLRCIYSI